MAHPILKTSRSSSGVPSGLSSRLVPRSYFTRKQAPKLVDAVQAGQKIMLDAGTDLTFQIIFAPPSKRGTHNARHTSINPIWYESLWHVIYAGEPPLAMIAAHCFRFKMLVFAFRKRQALGILQGSSIKPPIP